jgi:hypothetical protein
MKTMGFFFVVMTAAVLLSGTSLARQADHPSQPVPSQNIERSANDQRTGQKDAEVRGEKDLARSGEADDKQKPILGATRAPTERRPSATYSKQVPSRQPHRAKTSTANSRQTDATGRISALQPAGSNASVPNKAVIRRSVTPPPPTVAVNGQQFRNSRDPGARLANSGGPQTSVRGTAGISGTDMKRKP